MSWNDDSWRDGYDAWKIASPDDERDDYPCNHEDYEIDILTGRAHCDRCSESWHVSEDDIRRQFENEKAYYEHQEREHRRERWRNIWVGFKSAFSVFNWRKSSPIANDDDIPF